MTGRAKYYMHNTIQYNTIQTQRRPRKSQRRDGREKALTFLLNLNFPTLIKNVASRNEDNYLNISKKIMSDRKVSNLTLESVIQVSIAREMRPSLHWERNVSTKFYMTRIIDSKVLYYGISPETNWIYRVGTKRLTLIPGQPSDQRVARLPIEHAQWGLPGGSRDQRPGPLRAVPAHPAARHQGTQNASQEGQGNYFKGPPWWLLSTLCLIKI